MPIPFRDLGEGEPLGVAGFLRFIDEPDGRGIRGALFIMSARGEPVEFAFTRIKLRSGVLWRQGHARSSSVSALAKALFESASNRADVVFSLAEETPPAVFSDDIRPEIPLCRVASRGSVSLAPTEETQQLSESLTLYWTNGVPPPGSVTAQVVELLAQRQLLIEPFERAAMGIQEAFDS
ncbi:MAG: hypothetical protein F4X66_17065 [Chloroflexi bacterium]|nr:hypothetical protein [Chloroflexota bacterium]MYE41616.1 hypothetical protein [Chloroflexota bacterium]